MKSVLDITYTIYKFMSYEDVVSSATKLASILHTQRLTIPGHINVAIQLELLAPIDNTEHIKWEGVKKKKKQSNNNNNNLEFINSYYDELVRLNHYIDKALM